MANPLENFDILIADGDHQLAMVLKLMLQQMGFSNVQLTRNGQQALALHEQKPFDFLITEWDIQQLDGIALVNRIRRDPHSLNPTLPVIMLSGRAEKDDVLTARDNGVNEYVVKPFSAKAIYSRLERIIDHPRNFVVAQSFVGPDRRHKGVPPPGVSDRRDTVVQPTRQPNQVTGLTGDDKPKVWLPNYALKRKLGTDQVLQSLITPALLNQAQASINAITSDSLQWIKDNLAEIKSLTAAMSREKKPAESVKKIAEAALTINSRAGTFGYTRASEVAYMLYLFCRNTLNPKDAIHRTIVQKHIEVLQVILSNNVRGMTGAAGELIVKELQNLVNKYSQ